MAKVGLLKNKEFAAFERELKAIERMKNVMRGEKYFDTRGIPTKDKLLGLDQLRKFAHGRTKQRLTLFEFGQEKKYKKRTIRAYRKRLEKLIKRTVGGMTIKKLLFGIDRKISKSGPQSQIFGTSRKQRIKTISTVQYEKMLGNIVHLKVSASGDTKGAPSAYKFQVQFPGWSRARALHSGIRGVEEVLQDPVLIHCSCKDFQFMYGFVADSAGYAIESEQSYPKIKNPKLQNTMCKHGGRTGEALLKGEFGLKIALANAMKAQSKKKENIDKVLWEKAKKKTTAKEKREIKKSLKSAKRIEKKIREIEASSEALKRAEKGKVYKDFTKKEKDKLFKKLPNIINKATKPKAKPIESYVKDYAKKRKIDPKKAVPFARKGIKEIVDRYSKAAVKAVKGKAKPTPKPKQDKAVKASLRKGDKIVEKAKQMRVDLLSAKSFKDDPELYKMNLEHLSKKYGKSVSELKKMT